LIASHQSTVRAKNGKWQQAIGVAILSVHVLPFVLNFNRVATIAIANGKTGLYRNPCFCLNRPGMPELRDLYPVGDDEDVAAIALYRHLQRYGHCCPRKKRTQTQK
jgi:hypothetical protein